MTPRDRLRRWFLQRQRSRSGAIRLDRRQIYILPTRTGLLFAVVLVVMYVGAVNYNLGLGHALVFLLTGLGVVGMLHTFRNLVGLTIRAGRAEPVFAGQLARFEVLIENHREEMRPAVHLQLFEGNATSLAGSMTDLPAAATTAIPLAVPVAQRGKQPLGRLIVSSRFPLGIFRAWSYPWPAASCLVYPSPIFRPLPVPQGDNRIGGGAVTPNDDRDDFAGFRRHQPGDSPRHVAWKVFARDTAESPLLVKEFSGSGQTRFCFDWQHTEGDEETRLSELCGWILQAREHDDEFTLRLPGFELESGRGIHHAELALEALALFGKKP